MQGLGGLDNTHGQTTDVVMMESGCSVLVILLSQGIIKNSFFTEICSVSHAKPVNKGEIFI